MSFNKDSAGKWSVILAIVPLVINGLFWIFIGIMCEILGEGAIGLFYILLPFFYIMIILSFISFLTGIVLGRIAIFTKKWRWGIAGLILNLLPLIIAGILLGRELNNILNNS